jgi:hypothetical protein
LPDTVQKPRWPAVSIKSTSSGCEATRSLKGLRFLAGEAPRLPLVNCSRPEVCQCVYEKFDDRREGPRRDIEETGRRTYRDPGQERRRTGGRRDADKRSTDKRSADKRNPGK